MSKELDALKRLWKDMGINNGRVLMKRIKMPSENREVCKSKGIKCNKDCLCYGNYNLCYEETHLTIDELVSKICKTN